MKKQTNTRAQKTESTSPLLNTAIIAAVALSVLPAILFGAVRIFHSQSESSAKGVEVEAATPKRTSAAERRARHIEARKEKEAKARNIYPEITMEKVEPFYDDFGTDYDAEMDFNGFGMMPPAYMGGPVMMPAPYMGGPGMMPVPNRGNFNGGRRMPGADMGFNNGFGRGRGDF
jgi:hypothetical protein